ARPAQLRETQPQLRQRVQPEQRDRQEGAHVIGQRVAHGARRVYTVQPQRRPRRGLEHAHEARRARQRYAEADDPLQQERAHGGTGSPNARKHTANAAAFTSHSTTDQRTTASNRPGLLSTSSPATSPSAMWESRSAKCAGNTACAARPSSPSQGAGRCTTSTATSSTIPKKAAAVVVIADADVRPISAWR